MIQRIKEKIKSILGDVVVFRIKEFKNSILPDQIFLREHEDIAKRKIFYAQFIKENDLCFDVGANYGNRVSPLLELSARVVAIEPQEPCQRILKAKFGKRIEIVPVGLGEREEDKDFYVSDASYLSSFSKTWIDSVKKDRFKNNNWSTTRKIRMTTLDKLIERYGRPQFIKIDVEGYELSVLKGLSSPIPMISYEYTTPELTDNAMDCLKRVMAMGRRITCNYSVGESMKFELDRFVSAEKMISIIESKEFIQTGFGDIYLRGDE